MGASRKVSTKKIGNPKARKVGYGLIILNIVLLLFDLDITLVQFTGVWGVVALLLILILIAIWVFNIVTKLNRGALFWVFFAVLAAPLCLVIVGYLDTKRAKPVKKKIRNVMTVGGVVVQEDTEDDEVVSPEKKRKKVKVGGIVYDTNNCPACGFSITDAMDICPDCEVALR